MKEQLYSKVKIIIRRKQVYLINKLDEPIESLVYNTFSVLTTDDAIGVSSSTHFKIYDIPAGHAVYLETLDGWEDGAIHYNLVALKTATVSLEKEFSLNKKPLSGLIKLPPIAKCRIEKIEVTDGFVVEINQEIDKKTVNELYWLAEDLKAYADLTGSHFDTEKAQTKLWKMNPILSKFDFPKIQKLQNNLLGRLEIPMFFDKEEFSAKVDELYGLLEEMK